MIIFSWIGSFLLLYSYWLVTQNKVTKNTFFLNFLGSILIIITAITYQLWSVVFLNTIWTLCSLNGYFYCKNQSKEEAAKSPNVTPIFTFGKYKGRSVESVLLYDPNYVAWAYYNVTDSPVTESQAEQAVKTILKKPNPKRTSKVDTTPDDFLASMWHPEDFH